MPLRRKQICPHLKPTLPKMVQEIWRETTQAELFFECFRESNPCERTRVAVRPMVENRERFRIFTAALASGGDAF